MHKWKELLSKLLVWFFSCFPIQSNKILFFSYYGAQYGCNPKYISEYMEKHSPDGTYDLVWAFHHPEEKKVGRGVRKVKTMSFRYYYELCTSKVIITNFRTTNGFQKRKEQYYIQTWHSSLRLKQIEQDAEASLPAAYVEMAKKDSQKCDLLLSGSAFSTEIFQRAFWYEGEIIECGTPRNDLLFHPSSHVKDKVRNALNIPPAHKVVLYAPTFRSNDQHVKTHFSTERILEQLALKFGSEWTFLVKLHPHLGSKTHEYRNHDQVKDATTYDDIQELLCLADVLITDYSSLMFDFAITKRPCFLFIPDLHEYQQKDRKLYFKIETLPFLTATNEEALLHEIAVFDQEIYEGDLQVFLKKTGSFERGRACQHVFERIEDICLKKRGREADEAV